jgi:hypothetical protein
MKTSINIFVLVLIFFSRTNLILGQEDYTIRNFNLNIPIEIKGLSKDPRSLQQGYYKYSLEGFDFYAKDGNSFPLKSQGFNGVTNRNSPIDIVAELFYAWQTKNKEKLISLYSDASKNLAESTFSDKVFNNYSDVMVKETNPKVLMGYSYGKGFIVFNKFESLGIEQLYMEKKASGEYHIVPLNDTSVMNYNIHVFLNYLPKPFNKPRINLPKDTISLSEEIKIKLTVSQRANYIVFFFPKQNSPVFVNLPDMSGADLNSNPREIEFDITLGWFFENAGDNTFYAIESNFPISTVSERMIKEGVPIKFFLKK